MPTEHSTIDLEIQRHELHTLVWELPLTVTAPLLRTTPCKLVALCDEHHIPRPGKWYWGNLMMGRYVEVTPLPKEHVANQSTSKILFPDVELQLHELHTNGPHVAGFQKLLDYEKLDCNRIEVHDASRGQKNKVLAATKAALDSTDFEYNGRLIISPRIKKPVLRVSVSRSQVARAMRIAEAFVRACDRREFALVLSLIHI